MITATVTGFKFTNTTNDLGEAIEFFAEIKREGFWYAMTGQHFGEWGASLVHDIIDLSDYSLVVALVLGILAVFGSKKAAKGIYWTIAFYILIKALGTVLP